VKAGGCLATVVDPIDEVYPRDLDHVRDWIPEERDKPRKAARSVWQDPEARAQFLHAMDIFKGSNPAALSAAWKEQAYEHYLMCNVSLSWHGKELHTIHHDGRFLPWHRALLYFLEKMLQDGIGDKDLRLNYWNWESAHDRGIPQLFRSGTLDYADRYFGGLTKTDVDIDGLLAQTQLTPFLMSANSGPHGNVHLAFKKGGCVGSMAQIENAALDPVFFAHHANLDRLWCSWMVANGNPPYQSGPKVPDLIWARYRQKWWKLKTADLWDTTKLGYHYDSLIPVTRFKHELHLTADPNQPGSFVSRIDSGPRGRRSSQFLMIDNARIGGSLLNFFRYALATGAMPGGAKPPRGGAVGTFGRTPSGSARGHADQAGLSVWVALRSNTNLDQIVSATSRLTLHIAPVDADGTTLTESEPLVAEIVRIVY